MNRRQQGIYESWKRSEDMNLSDIYGRFSAAKNRAFIECRMKCTEEYGYRFRIISKNPTMFTVGYIFENEKSEVCFHYFAATKNEIFKIADNKEGRPLWEFC